ncbi:MAG TPA: AMP-binding protein [Stellaceae bacterium]|nr:AMP-binding protein [Stellaceae bacterium]
MPSFAAARDFLLAHREDWALAYAEFRWPEKVPFNWALDWFDGVLATDPGTRERTALHIVDTATGGEVRLSFAALAKRSNRLANRLRRLGLGRGDRILLLLGNVPELWETMLAAAKLGAVVIPATTLLTAEDLADRIERGRARAVVTSPEHAGKIGSAAAIRIATGDAPPPGWHAYDDGSRDGNFAPDGPTLPDDPLLLYFTSGTTARPKLVVHSHYSYPVGHLSTMYWLGLRPGDVHLNISSPGWAKHAWSSFFAPWNAAATVFIVNQPHFGAEALLDVIAAHRVTSLCAPPTVWRMLAQLDLTQWRIGLRELCGAGEPLNPEIIACFRSAWGLTIRDGYGQTETTAQIGNPPGQALKPGSMGRPLPGYRIHLLDEEDAPAAEGEICLGLDADRPGGLMLGYEGVDAHGHRLFHTGDVAMVDDDGYLTFVGRRDDVFKSSDYRISPFELESVLVEHPTVVEAAVVPFPDALRLSVPKAYVILTASAAPDRETALAIFRHSRAHLAPYKRIRRLEFVSDLPKTISGKIRRAQLRRTGASGVEFVEADFAELRG